MMQSLAGTPSVHERMKFSLFDESNYLNFDQRYRRK
jgi:hypothetical protein